MRRSDEGGDGVTNEQRCSGGDGVDFGSCWILSKTGPSPGTQKNVSSLSAMDVENSVRVAMVSVGRNFTGF